MRRRPRGPSFAIVGRCQSAEAPRRAHLSPPQAPIFSNASSSSASLAACAHTHVNVCHGACRATAGTQCAAAAKPRTAEHPRRSTQPPPASRTNRRGLTWRDRRGLTPRETRCAVCSAPRLVTACGHACTLTSATRSNKSGGSKPSGAGSGRAASSSGRRAAANATACAARRGICGGS
jgi:hypothetical protein